jgi:hypothetical protein
MTFSVWRIEDDCLQAAPKIRIDYKGPNPLGLVERILDVTQKVLGIKKTDMWESQFRWDINVGPEEPRRFYLRVYAPKTLDKKTSILIELVFNGKQPPNPTQSEILRTEIAARLITNYPLKGDFKQTWFYRTLLKAYHQATYASQRAKYLTTCTELAEKVAAEIRKLV